MSDNCAFCIVWFFPRLGCFVDERLIVDQWIAAFGVDTALSQVFLGHRAYDVEDSFGSITFPAISGRSGWVAVVNDDCSGPIDEHGLSYNLHDRNDHGVSNFFELPAHGHVD